MTVIGIDPSFTGCGISDGVRHEIISTKPAEGEDQITGLRRRCDEIVDGIARFVGDTVAPHIFIEAPMMAAPAHGGSHLFDLGWLMHDIMTCVPSVVVGGATFTLVPILAVKKFASGKGNTKKDEMKLAVFKKWGVEFERDPGCDKLHAFVLHKYGQAVLSGELAAPVIKRRGKGQGKDRKAA